MSYTPRSLFRLTSEMNNKIFLPHIQRPFVWEEEQMLRLFDSLMRSYPIQTLLFWKTKDEIKARRFLDQVSWDIDLSDYYDAQVSKGGVEKTFVLDGQQRLQSLYAIFCGAMTMANGQRGEAYFDATSGVQSDDFGILYRLQFCGEPPGLPWYRVADLLGKDDQKPAEDIAEDINAALDAMDLEQEPSAKTDRHRRVRRNFSQLVSVLREEKHFWVQELDGVANEFPYKKVLNIFVRVNSGGTKLDSSDLMFAAMKEGWEEFEEAVEETTELLNGTNLKFDKSFPLKCLLVTHGRGAAASPDKFTDESGRQLLKAMDEGWTRAEQAFRELRDFMQQDIKVYADKVIRTYNSFIPLFDYLYYNPKPSEADRAKMRAYHFKAQLFGWYSQSTDSIVDALHNVVGKRWKTGFPLEEIKTYFQGRGMVTDLTRQHLFDNRARAILLNMIYVDRHGTSPFDVKYKGNDPHVDHIYPQYALRTHLGLVSADINHLGNFRFFGATDNIRKRAELPAAYFARLKAAGVDVERHLLLPEYAADPAKLEFSEGAYREFRDKRFEKIWEISSRLVNG